MKKKYYKFDSWFFTSIVYLCLSIATIWSSLSCLENTAKKLPIMHLLAHVYLVLLRLYSMHSYRHCGFQTSELFISKILSIFIIFSNFKPFISKHKTQVKNTPFFWTEFSATFVTDTCIILWCLWRKEICINIKIGHILVKYKRKF